MGPFNRALTLCRLTGSSSLINGSLEKLRIILYRREEVFHRRYWEAVQAGSRIDAIAAIRRLPGDDICAHQYVILEDDHVYRIEQAQEAEDEEGVPIWRLSLRREANNYDIANITDKT